MKDALVSLQLSESRIGSRSSETSTDARGYYEFSGLSPGNYNVSVSRPGYAQFLGTVQIEASVLSTLDIWLGKDGDVSTGIHGTVRDSRGQPIGGAQVSLDYAVGGANNRATGIGSSRAIAIVKTGSDGSYTFAGLTAGDYVVRAEHPDYLPNGANVSLTAGQTVSRDITLYWKLAYNGHGEWLHGMWGTDAANVFAAGDMGIIKHFDGVSWSDIDTGNSNILLSIWGAQDGALMVAAGGGGTIISSSDRGVSWTEANVNFTGAFRSLWGYPDGSYIVAVTYSGGVFVSIDRARSFNPVGDLSYWSDIHGLYGTSNGNDLFAVSNRGTIIYSADSGVSWKKIYDEPSGRALNCIWGKPDGSLIVASGNLGAVVISRDGGKTWTESPGVSIAFVGDTIWGKPDGSLICIGGIDNLDPDSSVLLSTDEGASWNPVSGVTRIEMGGELGNL